MSSGWFGKTANMEKEVFFALPTTAEVQPPFLLISHFVEKLFAPFRFFLAQIWERQGCQTLWLSATFVFFLAQFFPWILSVALVRETEGGFYLKNVSDYASSCFCCVTDEASVQVQPHFCSKKKKNWRCPGQTLATPIFCVILISSRSALNLLQCHEACQLGCHTWYSFESSFSVFSRSYH